MATVAILVYVPAAQSQPATLDNVWFNGLAKARLTKGGHQAMELASETDTAGNTFDAGVTAGYTKPNGDSASGNTGASSSISIGSGIVIGTAKSAMHGTAQSFDGSGDESGAGIGFTPGADAEGLYKFVAGGSSGLIGVALYTFLLTFDDIDHYEEAIGLQADAANTKVNILVDGNGAKTTKITIDGQSQTYGGVRTGFLLPLDVAVGDQFFFGVTNGTPTGATFAAGDTEDWESIANVFVFDAVSLDFDASGAVGFGDADFLSGLGADPTQGGITDASFGLLLGDLNTDGLINTGDMTILVETHGGSVIGDVSGNGLVFHEDYTILVNNWGTGTVYSQGDLTADGVVGPNDYTVWANNFGRSASPLPAGPASAIPEPSSMLLLGIGLFGMAVAGRSRRRR